jgi:kynureninase
MDDALLRWRSEFPIVERTTYLVSNSLGAMPVSARASLLRYADTWDSLGVRAWAEGWWTLQDEVAALLGPILGVPRGTVSMHQNVAVASQAILSCFRFERPRNRIVLTDHDFPSVMYLYEAQRARGAEIVRVPGEDGVGVSMERLLRAIDERTLLVPVSHVFFRSACILDAKALIDRAHEVGAFVVLDVFQSVGTVPLRLAEWNCDAAVGGALKFLCGGPGAGFLYVREDHIGKLEPSFTGWMAHQRPFDFDIGGQELRRDGGRFLHGTPNVPALYAAREGIRIVGEIGVDAIRAKSMRQTARLVGKARAMGFPVTAPADAARRGGTVAVDVPDGYEVTQELLARDFVVDYRPGAGIRIAPHFYTKDEECDLVLDEIGAILRSGEHRRRAPAARKPG